MKEIAAYLKQSHEESQSKADLSVPSNQQKSMVAAPGNRFYAIA